ncbi:hypothetical protein GCM10023350_36040 [Nocardioides endophyticus]|uniref:Methylase-associated X1 domain-containing protein n=1 Tax=Nocardioides endophyticus TaxID=1353775 RepID=A0ABP8Z6I4_9ACTN
MNEHLVAGRDVGEVYRVSGRRDLHTFLLNAVSSSGGRVLYASDASRAPVYLGIQASSDERIGVLVYPFRITRNTIRNRPADEVRGQLRYGSEDSWERPHPVARDIAGVDVSLIVGIDLEDEVFVGLDAQLWDPLPMGISFYAKASEIELARTQSWHVWEKINRSGTRRRAPRSPSSLETVVAFQPHRFIDYLRLERRAASLRLDPALRFSAAEAMLHQAPDEPARRHVLEEQFALTSEQILDIIGGRNRLSVAVRGGVAEHHLERRLREDPGIAEVRRLDVDAMHDFDVTTVAGEVVRVECKNASPKLNAAGQFRVEVQKTRSSKSDPASRFYPVDAFDVVAACVFSATGRWDFWFGRTAGLPRHSTFSDRLTPIQVVDSAWTSSLDPGASVSGREHRSGTRTDVVFSVTTADVVDPMLEEAAAEPSHESVSPPGTR